jgi:hypothetical protein
LIRSISHILDDCWQEEGEGVNGAEASHADEHVDVDFPIFDSLQDVFVSECVGEVSVVDSQAALDFFALVFGEEFGSVEAVLALFVNDNGYIRCGIIVDGPIRGEGDNYA